MARTKNSMVNFKKSEMAKTKKSVRRTKEQENPQALIGQRLKKYRTHEEIVNLAHRLFQKCPSVSMNFEFVLFQPPFHFCSRSVNLKINFS